MTALKRWLRGVGLTGQGSRDPAARQARAPEGQAAARGERPELPPHGGGGVVSLFLKFHTPRRKSSLLSEMRERKEPVIGVP